MIRGILLLTLLSGLIFGQQAGTVKLSGTRTDKPADFEIRLGCGIAGTYSSQLNAIHQLIYTKHYAALVKNLRSEDLLTQLLSAIATEELYKRNELVLTTKDFEIISQVKASDKTYYCCNGCTGHFHGKIAEIFKPHQGNYNNILILLRLQIGLDKYE